MKVTSSDVHKNIKAHSRLTGYDVWFNAKPTLDKLQNSFRSTGTELKNLVLRMPSILGMSKRVIVDKLELLLNEGML